MVKMAKRTISIALLVAMLVSIFSIPAVAQVHEDEYLAACIHSYENFSENFDTTRLYLNALDRINSSRIIEGMLNLSAEIIKEDLSVERCVGILSNLASAVNLRMEDQIIAQADYDTTKTWVEYTQDVSDIVSGAIGIDDELQGKLLDTLKDCISYDGIVISFLGDSIDSVNLFYNLAGDYRMQYDFLMNVKRYSELENMREAAGILLRCNEKLMLAKLEGIASVSEDLAKTMGKDIFLDSMSKDLIQEFIDGDEVDQALAFGFGCYNEIMDKIVTPAKMYFQLGIFAGDMLFGTSNIFNRYTEMTALKDIRNANLMAIEKNPVASAKDSLEAIEKNRNAYYCILGADLRGESCLNQMLTSEGQLLSILNLGKRDEYNDQYDDTYFVIKTQFSHLDGLIPDRSNFDYEETGAPESLENEQYIGTWTIDIEKTNNSNSTSLQGAYGTGIKYGYELVLGEDGSFSWGIGIGNGGEGTWWMENEAIYADETEYELGEQERITLTVLQEDGQVWLVQDHYGYTLYWIKEERAPEQPEASSYPTEADNEYVAMYMDFIESGSYLQDVYSGHEGLTYPDGERIPTDNYAVDFDNAKTGWAIINITDRPELIIYADVGEAADLRTFFWVYRCWRPESNEIVTPYYLGGGAGPGDKLYYTDNLEADQQVSDWLVDGLYYEGDFPISGASVAYQCCAYNGSIYCSNYTIGDLNLTGDSELPCSLDYGSQVVPISQQDFDYCISSLKEITFHPFPESETAASDDSADKAETSAWPELTDYYWYRNVQSWEIYEFRSDGTFQVYYTEMPITPSENSQLSQADLVSSGQSGRYDFDGEKLTMYPDDGASYSMDLYDRSRDPYPDDDAAQYVSDYDGTIYFYETDWEPVEIAGIVVTDHSYLVRLGKKTA